MYQRWNDENHVEWSKQIHEKYRNFCQICYCVNREMHAHHMNSYIDHPDERYDINNGILICKEHHEMYHNIYGKGSNTKKQFEEFVLIIRIIEQIVELKKDLTDTAQSIIITERKTGTECTEITSQNITLLLHQN